MHKLKSALLWGVGEDAEFNTSSVAPMSPNGTFATYREPDFRQVEAKRDELAQEYAATYPRLAAQFVDLFERIEAVDKEVSRINGSAPSGGHRRLRQVELVARGLDNFSRADPPITKAVQLPDWTNSEKMIWPPPQPSLAVQVATTMTYGPHPGANWWQESKARAQAMREEQERVAAFYEAQARQREEREHAAAGSVAGRTP
jgi:hypothetical protein